MPSDEIMGLFKQGKLHSSSPKGEIVTNPHQAKAILLSYLRKEGKVTTPDPNTMAGHLSGMKKAGKLKSKAMKGYGFNDYEKCQ